MKRILSLLLVLTMVFTLCACSSGNSAASESNESESASTDGEVYNVTLATVWSLDHSVTKLLDEFYIPYVTEKTNGKVVINHHPNSELGSEGDLAQSVMSGTIQMGALGDLIGLNQVKQVEVLELPYLWETEDEFWDAVSNEEYQKIIEDELKNYDLSLLCLHKRGFRQTTTEIPINSMDDLKGLVMRMPSVEMMIEAWECYGIIPSIIAWSDVYSALQQGVAHGSEGSLDSLWAMKLFEVNPCLAMTNHQVSMGMFVVNDTWFSSLPQEYQDVLKTGAEELAVKIREDITANEKIWMEDFETVTYPDPADFIEASKPVYEHYIEQYPWAVDILEMFGKGDRIA